MAGVLRWVFSESKVLNTPSRKCGIDADKELSYRQQAANFIQDIGQRLNLRLLVTNTAIVYMHRFYMFHSFTKFQRNIIAAACLFLAAKVEEAPRKLEHVIRVYHRLLHRDAPPLDVKSNEYLEKVQELVINENILLQTLGFDVCVTHPHSHIVKICDLVRASKDLTQTSYILATNSLHLTMMSVKYRPTVVACVCIHLACKWASVEIPKSSEGKSWWEYADKDITLDQVEQIAQEFVNILDKFPNRLKRAMQIARGEKPQPEPTSKPAQKGALSSAVPAPSATTTKSTGDREQSRSPAPSSSSVADGHKSRHHQTPTNHDRKPDLKTQTGGAGSRTVSPHVSKTKAVDSPLKHRSMYDVVDSSKVSGLRQPALSQSSRSSHAVHGDPKHRSLPVSSGNERVVHSGSGQEATAHSRDKLDGRERPHERRPHSSSQLSHSSTLSLPRHKSDARQNEEFSKHLPFERYKEHRSDHHKVQNQQSDHVSGSHASVSSIGSSSVNKSRHSTAVAPGGAPQLLVGAPQCQLELSVHNQEHFNRIKKDHSGHDRHPQQRSQRPGEDNSQHSFKRSHSPSGSSAGHSRKHSSSSLPHSSKKARLDPSRGSSAHRRSSSSGKSHNGHRSQGGGSESASAVAKNVSGLEELNELNKKLQHFIELQGQRLSSHSSSSSPEGGFQPPLPSHPPLPHTPPPPPPPEHLPPLPPS